MSNDIAKPPLNVLFNPNLIARKDIWQIDLVSLLDMLIDILEARGYKDLRVCGIAALSSAMILRLKVESIFALEKIANRKKPIVDRSIINNISIIDMPYRFEARYQVSLEDLLNMLEKVIESINKPKDRLELEPIDSKEFDKYLITFEELLEEYKKDIYDRLRIEGKVSFNEFVKNMNSIDATRYFIATLYLAMEGKVDLYELDDDVIITLYGYKYDKPLY